MNKVSELIINIEELGLDLQLKNIEKSVHESNDKVYFFENEWLELGVQFVEDEPKQYIVYPKTNKFSPRDYESLELGVSIYLVEDFSNYLQEVVKNFYEQLKVIEELLVDKMKLKRYYDLTDEWYKKRIKKNTNIKSVKRIKGTIKK